MLLHAYRDERPNRQPAPAATGLVKTEVTASNGDVPPPDREEPTTINTRAQGSLIQPSTEPQRVLDVG